MRNGKGKFEVTDENCFYGFIPEDIYGFKGFLWMIGLLLLPVLWSHSFVMNILSMLCGATLHEGFPPFLLLF